MVIRKSPGSNPAVTVSGARAMLIVKLHQTVVRLPSIRAQHSYVHGSNLSKKRHCQSRWIGFAVRTIRIINCETCGEKRLISACASIVLAFGMTNTLRFLKTWHPLMCLGMDHGVASFVMPRKALSGRAVQIR